MRKRITAVLLAVILSVSCLQIEVLAAGVRQSGSCGDQLTWTLDTDGVLTIRGAGPMMDYDAYVWGEQEPWYDCRDSIRKIVIESGATSIGKDAFEHCHNVAEVTIPGTVQSIGECAFLMNISLQKVIIPEGVTDIGEHAFAFCEKLSSAPLPSTLKNLGACAFYEDPLTEVTIPDGVQVIRWSTFQDCTALRSVVLPDSVTSIENKAFQGCTSLASISGGSGVSELGAGVFADTPWQAAQGDYVVFGSVLAGYNGSGAAAAVPSGVKKIAGSVFEGHKELKSISIPSSVTEIGEKAFSQCTSLSAVKMPFSLATVGAEAFSGCSSLKTLTLSKNLKTLGTNAFAGCTALTAVDIPKALREADEPFSGCSRLKKISFQEGRTSIPARLFKNCSAISEISFPDGLKVIGEEAFSGCSGLTEILFPETLEEIGWNAFSQCSGLQRVYIPLSVTHIGSGAFEGAADGMEAYYAGNEMDFLRLDEGTRSNMANGYAPYFNADGFSLPVVIEPDPDGYARSGRRGVKKATWRELCEKFDMLLDEPETLFSTSPSAASKGYHIGVLTNETVNYYQNAINYYRTAATVGPITLTKQLNENAAWGALIQAIRNGLSHNPPQPSFMKDEDYAKAYYASSNSNLAINYPPDPLGILSCMMDDSDSANAHDLGHRRWLLAPQTLKMGVGLAYSESGYLAGDIRVMGDGVDVVYYDDYDFVAWPASGNNLIETCTPDVIWSVSVNDGSNGKYQTPRYSEVKVKVQSLETGTEWLLSKDASQETTGWFNVSSSMYGYMSAIVFQPNSATCFHGDYVVTVSGLHLKDGSSATIKYKVTFKFRDEDKGEDTEPEPIPLPDPDNPFVDVVKGKFYYEPVLWAVKNNITKGVSETAFEPGAKCTRAQVVTFLWRALGCPEPKSLQSPFDDVNNPKSWYYKAILWAAENEVTAGVDPSHFAPEEDVTRAQFVTFLWRAAGKEAPKNGANPFDDITNPDSWYYNAVLWAVEKGITKGKEDTLFAPGDNCSRGEVVTFLYRYMNK